MSGNSIFPPSNSLRPAQIMYGRASDPNVARILPENSSKAALYYQDPSITASNRWIWSPSTLLWSKITSSAPPTPNGLLVGLAAYWKMDETGGGGTDRIDATGNGYDLADVQANVGSITGIINDGCDFLVATYGLESPKPAAHGGDLSFSCWVNIPSSPAGLDILFQCFDFSVYINSNPIYGVTATFYTTDGQVDAASGITFGGDFWHHVIATRKAATNTVKLYIDGVLAATGVGTGTIISLWPDVVDMGNGSGGQIVEGYMDETGMWNKELTQIDVTNLYNGGAGLPFSSFTN